MSLIDLVKGKTKDSSGKLVDPTDYDNAIGEALKQYSNHRPRLTVADLVGTGGHDLVLPTNWSAGLSAIQSVEYPIGSVPETLIERDDWKLYQTPTGISLRLIEVVPPLSALVRILYTTLHDEASVPVADQEAVANLAASICCRQLAAAYAQTSDPMIAADTVNYRSKSSEFSALAKQYVTLYKSHLGIKDDDVTPAAMTTATPPDNGRTRLTHWSS